MFQSRPRVFARVFLLLEKLGRRDDLVLGLLTGNYEFSGRMKLKACGVKNAAFTLGAFGEDASFPHPHRRNLPPVAQRRFELSFGHAAENTIIIGDTPHDVDCAHAHGLPALGVATGTASLEELKAAGADLAIEDLSDVNSVFDWIANASRR
ncbi:MAG: HAD hydrolase-like protein [Planctomycetota bacterium]